MSVFGALPNGTQGRIASTHWKTIKIVPSALHPVSAASRNRYHNHCAQVIDEYADRFKYGTIRGALRSVYIKVIGRYSRLSI